MNTNRRWLACVSGLVPVLLRHFVCTRKSRDCIGKWTKPFEKSKKLAGDSKKCGAGACHRCRLQDKILYAKGFGVHDVKTKAPVDADTVFQLASVSKPVVSTVVAKLVGEGKMRGTRNSSVLDPVSRCSINSITRECTITRYVRRIAAAADTLGRPPRFAGFTRASAPALSASKSSFRSHYAYTISSGMTLESGGEVAKALRGTEWREASNKTV